MAGYKGEEFKFPDEQTNEPAEELNAGGKVEIEIEDDTPAEEKKFSKKESKRQEDPTDEELLNYKPSVSDRYKKLTKGFHEERRAKEQALAERIAAERAAVSAGPEQT